MAGLATYFGNPVGDIGFAEDPVGYVQQDRRGGQCGKPFQQFALQGGHGEQLPDGQPQCKGAGHRAAGSGQYRPAPAAQAGGRDAAGLYGADHTGQYDNGFQAFAQENGQRLNKGARRRQLAAEDACRLFAVGLQACQGGVEFLLGSLTRNQCAEAGVIGVALPEGSFHF
ncbi:hypothetical protein D9M68_760560 [compost metagenome]